MPLRNKTLNLLTVLILLSSILQGQQQAPNRAPRAQPPGAVDEIPVPEGVVLETDIAYRKGNDRWLLDLAHPEDLSGSPKPGLVVVHGGG